jgi:hypothetical protein
MKNLIKLLVLLSLLFLLIPYLHSQEIGDGELMIVNNTANRILSIEIFPVGAIFSGGGQYTVDSRFRISDENKYLYPTETQYINYEQNNNFIKANFDASEYRNGCAFSLGYGKYKIIFTESQGSNIVWVDFSDANFNGTSTQGYLQKLKIVYTAWNDIKFQYIGTGSWGININDIPDKTIKVWQQDGTGNSPLIPFKGDFCDTVTFHDFPIVATDYGARGHDSYEVFFMSLKIKNQGANSVAEHMLIFVKSDFKIMDGITYTINGAGNNMIMSEGKFITKNDSKIKIPESFFFELFSCKVELNRTTFEPNNANSYWNCFRIVNPYDVNINNCTFKNAQRSIWIVNNFLPCTISDCTFDNFSETGIYVENTKNSLISGNHFNAPSYSNPCIYNWGIYVYDLSSSEEENNNNTNSANISIINNDFHNGITHIETNPLGNNLPPVYIKGNIFEEGINNILLRNTVGTISGNTGTITNIYENTDCMPINVCLMGGNLDFLNNTFTSSYNNFEIYSFNRTNLAPITSEGELLWVAGRNSLTSINKKNIISGDQDTPSFFITEYGNNSFSLENQDDRHFYGYMNTGESIYQSSANCWYRYGASVSPNIEPKSLLWNSSGGAMTIQINPPPYNGCNSWDYQVTDRIITDMGNGIFDTVLVTQSNYNPPPSGDISLFETGIKNKKLKNYSNAILIFKNLIDNYSNSKYLENSIYNLYECYTRCDTNHNQNWRHVIFGDLKNYFENKIQQYDTIETFVNLSFDFYIRCEIMKKEYQLALDGYEFIVENSPSATERLMASINYIDVEGLLQGSGGGQKDKYEDELSSDRNGKPIKDILLASYKSTKKSNEKREKSDLQNSLDVAQTKDLQQKKHKQEKVLENRAVENISISSGLTKKERRERIQKDLMLLNQRLETSEKIVKKNNSEAMKYELSQNYPNPFNPITNIKYQIQKTGLVTLKIYDITGREIRTLVNEIKNPGSYIVSFNGTEFASGVYFYRIQSGDFVQVKKMVLIK